MVPLFNTCGKDQLNNPAYLRFHYRNLIQGETWTEGPWTGRPWTKGPWTKEPWTMGPWTDKKGAGDQWTMGYETGTEDPWKDGYWTGRPEMEETATAES